MKSPKFGYMMKEQVDAKDPYTLKWRAGVVTCLTARTGKAGYYVRWTQPGNPASLGGWYDEASMRKSYRNDLERKDA